MSRESEDLSAPVPERLPLEPFIERYWDHVRIARGLSRNTLLAYQRDVATFQRYLRDRQVSDVREMSPPLLAGFLDHLHRSGLASSSRARAHGAGSARFPSDRQRGV